MMQHTIRRFGQIILLMFIVTIGYTIYWGVFRREALLSREDNPRQIEQAARIQRGSILDRNDRVLAESILTPNGVIQRQYPVPEVAPVVGYYSLRFGEGGIEASFNDVLSGQLYLSPMEQWWYGVLGRAPAGGDVRLTLDRRIQQQVERQLEQRGAVVLLDAQSGDILAMASRPSFNPNTLDEQFDTLSADPAAPLLNRATQSLYQPGTIMQSVVYASALNYNTFDLQTPWDAARIVQSEDGVLSCAAVPAVTLDTVYDLALWSCPAPLLEAQATLEDPFLLNTFEDYGLTSSPPLPIDVAEVSFDASQADLSRLVVGQGDLTVSPLHMALVAAAFSNNGRMPAPQLIEALRPPGGDWQMQEPIGIARGTISPAANSRLSELWRASVENGASQAAALPDRTVYGQSGLALSGDSFTAWFIGFTHKDDGTPIAVAVVLEDERSAQEAARIGRIALRTALNP